MFQVESKKETENVYLYSEYGTIEPSVRLKRYIVYNVRDDSNGYPTFLIYKDGQWLYRSAKYFQPIMEGEQIYGS